MLRWKFIAVKAYIRNEEISKIKNLCFQIRIAENEEKIKPGVPIVVQRLANLTSIHEDMGSIPGPV